MNRRIVLWLLTVAGAGTLTMGHSPYRQWYLYRRLRLFIATSAADARSYPLGEAIAAVLATHLPDSRAMAARARDAVEIAKLLGSEQLDVGLLRAAEARDALAGEGPFAENGPVLLSTLTSVGEHLIVCRADFPDQKAYQIAKTLADHWQGPEPFEGLRAGAPDASGPIPPHPAVVEYYRGRASKP